MTSELIKKITGKSKQLLFQASRNYKSNKESTVPYEEFIVVNKMYSDFYFLVHKNMIFNRGSISDSSYDVYSFNKKGEYVKKEDVKELGKAFFKNMQTLKEI